jgi:predicted chitinase
MRAHEFVIEKKKRKKRKPRWAAYGPGPFGGYGYATGYSGAVGGDGGGGVGEASYAGNIGAMEVAKFYQVATDEQKRALKDLINREKRDLAWALIQKVTGVKLQGKEFQTDEGWKDTLAGIGLAGAIGLGGIGGMAAKQALTSPDNSAQQSTGQSASGKIGVAKKEIKIDKNAVPKKSVTGSPHEKFLTKAAVEAGIKGEELAQFLAQTAHESHNFQSMVEYGGSLDFKKYEPVFKKDKTGKVVQVNAKAKTLGNVKKGDGVRYKGRGYIQLTGRYNYKIAGQALGLPLEAKPELVEKPEIAAKVAIWFWELRVQPRVDDFGNTPAATKPINPGLKGLEDRKEKFQDFKLVMK